MSAYLFRLRQRAVWLGISAYELARRRFLRARVVACVDDAGTIYLKPKVHCDPDLPGWLPIFKTETN